MNKDELTGRMAETNNFLKQLDTIKGLMSLIEKVKYAPITRILDDYLKTRVADLREFWREYYIPPEKHISDITKRICPLSSEQRADWCKAWNCNKYDTCIERGQTK